MTMQKHHNQFTEKTVSAFKSGLDYQREVFKEAKMSNDYDRMCDVLENIEAEINHKLTKADAARYKRILKIIYWYRSLETSYTRPTPEGKMVIFPPDIHNRANQNLTVAFKLLIQLLAKNNLL